MTRVGESATCKLLIACMRPAVPLMACLGQAVCRVLHAGVAAPRRATLCAVCKHIAQPAPAPLQSPPVFPQHVACTTRGTFCHAGTLDYMAPEVLRCPLKRLPGDNKDKQELHYDGTVDTWAVGVLAFELLVGRWGDV